MSEVKTAFETWFMDACENDPKKGAAVLYWMISENLSQDNIVWDLLKETGDQQYTEETFIKAAKKCLEKPNNPDVITIREASNE